MLLTIVVRMIANIVSILVNIMSYAVVKYTQIAPTDVCDNLVSVIGRYILDFTVNKLRRSAWRKPVNNRIDID